MDPKIEHRPPSEALRLLAGLETGVWGGIAMLAWLALGSLALRNSVWTIPDLISAVFSGHPVPRGLTLSTFPGLALHMFTSGTLGLLFALATRYTSSVLRTKLMGLLTGLVWYYVSYDVFWKRLGPSLADYVTPWSLLVAHMLFGAVLGFYPNRVAAACRRMPVEPPAEWRPAAVESRPGWTTADSGGQDGTA